MADVQPMRALAALLCAFVAAFSQPVWAEDKAAVARVGKAEAKYDSSQQAALLQKQVAALPPQQKGVTDIYAIGVAGWASEDVFRNELAGALAVTGKALPLRGIVRLINSPNTATKVPLASRQNFAAAVRAIAGVMDKNEDVLFLFMTSHGLKEGFILQLPSSAVRLAPPELAAILDSAEIKYRVVVVSACFSGIFVPPLANDNTIVLTASDAKSPSFGCASGRQWTYFGDALFNRNLKPWTDFGRAYAGARGLIEEWEKRDKLEPSNPQAHLGPGLMFKLAPLFEANARQQ